MGPDLQKLLSDSTETFFILKIILLVRGELEKNTKMTFFLENNDTSSFKSLFPYSSSFQIINFLFFVIFSGSTVARSIFFKIKKFQSNRIMTFGDTGPTGLRTLFREKRV